MFNNERYATSCIMEEIPFEVQLVVWTWIDNLKITEVNLDYLQVFEL